MHFFSLKKDDVSTLLDKASLESKESLCFIKAAKVLMKRNSADIMKIREVFQKYGYNPRAKSHSGVPRLHLTALVFALEGSRSVRALLARPRLSRVRDAALVGGAVSGLSLLSFPNARRGPMCMSAVDK